MVLLEVLHRITDKKPFDMAGMFRLQNPEILTSWLWSMEKRRFWVIKWLRR